jgi:hypothetical protein
MIADLHIHYPMRGVADVTTATTDEAIGGMFIKSLGRLPRTGSSGR